MMAAEPLATPVADYAPRNSRTASIPKGLPQSVEEALADINEGELEFQRGETISHRQAMQMIWNRIETYAGQI